MRVAIIQFPGANCDQDAVYSLRDDVGVQAEYVWHEETSLAGFEGVFLPGGFAYGDYLRAGAIAARAKVMSEVCRFALEGKPVLGACNGFQVLCEAGLLPGALLPNSQQKFVCKDVYLERLNTTSPWLSNVKETLRIPIAHGEGRYVCDDATLSQLRSKNLIAFRYAPPVGNPNGSLDNIAGIINPRGNVLGLMPHPERATKVLLGSVDGLQILGAFKEWPSQKQPVVLSSQTLL